MASTLDSDDDGFQLEVVVEQKGHCAAFAIPEGWSYDVHTVDGLTVEVLTPPRTPGVASRMPLVTFHDIAMNAAGCFGAFFTFCRTSGLCPELSTSHAHYHLTAPGHSADAPSLPQDTDLSVPTLAATANAALERLGVRRAVGFGVGLGGSILVSAALAEPRHWGGLVLVSPPLFGAGILERAWAGADAAAAAGVGLGRRAKDGFLARWLSPATRDANYDLTQTLEDEIDRLSVPNLLRFASADVGRPDLSGRLRALRANTLLVSGRESALRTHAADGYAMFDPARVTWLDVPDAGALVLEEQPEKVARSLSLFLQPMGAY